MTKNQAQDVPFDYAETTTTRVTAPPIPDVPPAASGHDFGIPINPEAPEGTPSASDIPQPLTREDLRAMEARVEYLQDFIARKFSADRQKQELYDRLYEHMNGMKEGFHWEIIKPLVNAVIGAIDANDAVSPRTAEIDMLHQGLCDILLPYGVERMDVVAGHAFDAKRHMALRTAELPGTPSGQVLEVVKAGYLRGDRILRPAQVSVSR